MRGMASVGRRRAVKNKSGGKICAICGEAESLRAAPAESGDEQFAVCGGELQGVVGGGVEIGGDLIGIEFADGFGGRVTGKIFCAAAAGSHAAEQVWRDGDVAGGGNFVGELLRPVAEAENFVDDEDDGALVFRFGVDDERFDAAGIVLHGDPFAVARGLREALLRPGLRPDLRGARWARRRELA